MKTLNELSGMLVSIDVSTSDDDSTHRIFGRVSEVMLKQCGAEEDTILAIEESRNFKPSVSRELLESAQIAFGILGGNRIGGEYRSEWEQCRDALNALMHLQKMAESIGEQL